MTSDTIAVFAPMYPPAVLGGGPIRSIQTIAASASDARYDLRVVTRDRDLGASDRLPVPANVWTVREGIMVRFVSTHSVTHYLAAMADLRKQRPKLLYFNSFFDPALAILPQLLTRVGWWRQAARAVAVRGEFSSAALAIKARKKRWFLRIYRGLRLHRGVIWHATSSREAEDIRRVMGRDINVVIRSDGGTPTVVAEDSLVPREGVLRALFLGRIVPIKGLDDALVSFRSSTRPFVFDIYGPVEDEDYARRCRDLARALPNHIEVSFRGTVEPGRVDTLMANYDVLVMPSHSENFGHVIGEALAAGVPVLVRDVTPWTPYIASGGGVVVSGADGWADAIAIFAVASAERRLELRIGARNAYLEWRGGLRPGHLFDDLLVASRHVFSQTRDVGSA